jgi:pimeloyl-ACP methyl ester carboxylesterase
MSRGGQYALRWATTHPDKVCGIYADNPGGDDDILRGLLDMARNDVPLFLLCGSNDPLLPHYAGAFETIYEQYGGRVSMMIKDGAGHHPHSLNDPKPMADFLEASAQEKPRVTPDFVGPNPFTRSSYYSLASVYAHYPQDGYYITRRGAAFTECYDKYSVSMGFEVPVTVIVPKKAAPGKPWVLRSSYVPRDAAVAHAPLAQGFHIVVGPVGYNADGPVLADWNKLYTYLTEHGFSNKPVLEGEGGGAGTVYGWAVENPNKVACVFAENPLMHAAGVETQPIDRLSALAKAGVALMHVCGVLEPSLTEEQREVEKRYRDLNGSITIVPGALTAETVKAAVGFILSHSGN